MEIKQSKIVKFGPLFRAEDKQQYFEVFLEDGTTFYRKLIEDTAASVCRGDLVFYRKDENQNVEVIAIKLNSNL